MNARMPEIEQIVLDQVLKVLQGGVEPRKAIADAQRLVTARVIAGRPLVQGETSPP
jgi:multiple sugar transport system substrate-binding protein